MESSELYQSRLNSLEQAIEGFSKSLNQDVKGLDSVLLDLVYNGQVQKFEYSTELLWKVLKQYLYEEQGIDESSPKGVIKAFFRIQKIY